MIISKFAITHHYNITPFFPTAPVAQGRLFSQLYTPKSGFTTSHPTFGVTTFYLRSGTSPSAKADRARLAGIMASPPWPRPPHAPPIPEFLGGDKNFTSLTPDRSTLNPRHIGSASVRRAWALMLSRRGLHEIPQPFHTFYRKSSDVHGLPTFSSSRIDTVLTSYGPAEAAILTPHAKVVGSCPYTFTNYPRSHSSSSQYIDSSSIPPRGSPSSTHVTDHIPIQLSFSNTLHQHHTAGNTIPKWTTQHPSFPDFFLDLCSNAPTPPPNYTGMDKLRDFNSHIHTAAKMVSKLRHNAKPTGSEAHLAAAILTYRTALNPSSSLDDIHRAASSGGPTGQDLLLLLDPKANTPLASVSRLKKHIEATIHSLAPTPTLHTSQPLSVVERLAKAFPKLRPRISSLTEEGKEPTSDPSLLTDITHRFWSNHWRRVPLRNRPARLFRHYAKPIRAQPRNITNDDVLRIIAETKHSAAGPNNIPFAAYRALADHFAPVFLSCVNELMDGVSPHPDFNSGILHLIEKKATGRISDTRPIVVSNADNRIIASIIRWAITPCIEEIIDHNQSGFLPGRSMLAHIEFYNERFYKALEDGDPYSVLFFDFAKAFDSCSHVALFAALSAAGLPPGIINAIRGLFHQAHCYTNFKGASPKKIFFLSGIKQGCPLSPLLFVLMINTLSVMVATHLPSTDFKLFADDTAAGASNLHLHVPTLRKIFKIFEQNTNLGLNPAKSFYISTLSRAQRIPIRSALNRCGWSRIQYSGSTTYLGIPCGRSVEVADAFRPGFAKFRASLLRYFPSKNRITFSKRVLITNVFLLPLLSYPQKFFIWPRYWQNAVTSDIWGWLNRFNSLSLPMMHTPTDQFGLPTPLLHFLFLNYASLASAAKLANYSPDFSGDVRSMRITTHRQLAVHFIHTNFNLAVARFLGQPQGIIYRMILNSPVYRLAWSQTYTAARLSKWGTPQPLFHAVTDRYVKVAKWTPPYAKVHFFLFTHNSLPTSHRLSRLHRGGNDPSPHIAPGLPCFLCDSDVDSGRHIYQDCSAVLAALVLLHAALGFVTPPPSLSTLRAWTTLEAPPLADPNLAGIMLLFCYAVWNLRRQRENLSFSGVSLARAVYADTMDRVAFHGASVLNVTCLPNITLSAAQLADSRSRGQRRFGSAGSRSASQSAAASKMVADLLATIPSDAAQLWTDGSALNNPGPAGGGCLTIRPDGSRTRTSIFLGRGTNQLGELAAISCGLRRTRLPPSTTLHVFTDSKFALNVATGSWLPTKHFKLAAHIRQTLRASPNPTLFHWVPAHNGVAANEEVDDLAKQGAIFSKSLNHTLDVENILINDLTSLIHFEHNSSPV
jgi:ribonuclease HI